MEEGEPLPKEAQAIKQILSSLDVKDYEPQVVNQLLEFSHRYIIDVLNDALVYMDHAGRTELELSDITLAIQCRVNYSFTPPPPVEFLSELAQLRNVKKLPDVPSEPGVHLPRNVSETIGGDNFRVDIKKS